MSKIDKQLTELKVYMMRVGIGEKYTIHMADARLGVRFAIITTDESTGAIRTHTSYMPYVEMTAFLYGYGLGTGKTFK